MKNSLLPLILLTCLGAQSCRTYLNKLDNRHQSRYFPVEYANIYLGIPLAEAKIIRPAMNQTDGSDSLHLQFSEYIGRNEIESTLYFFNKTLTSQPLERMVIEFETVEETQKLIRWRYGKPNNEEGQWTFDSKEGFMMDISTNGKTITIEKEQEATKPTDPPAEGPK